MSIRAICRGSIVLIGLILPAIPSGVDSSSQADRSLVVVGKPAPETAARLMGLGIVVVRDMGEYILATATEADVARLRGQGIRLELLDRGIEGRTYYTVGYDDAGRLAGLDPRVRILKATAHSAVIEARPAIAERLSAAGLELACVFMRPIRLPAARRVAPQRIPLTPNPLIEEMVATVSGPGVDGYVQRLQDFFSRRSMDRGCFEAADYIKAHFESAGIDSVSFHHFRDGWADNVVAVMPGVTDPDKQIVIGGHYDSIAWDGLYAPGADDNASGTACVLECARVLGGYQFDYTIVFIAFCGEEQGLRGSEAYAAAAADRGDDIVAMVNVDMIGYVADGDAVDIDIIDNVASEWLRDRVMTVGGLYVPNFGIVDGALPGGSISDHASFWAHGYEAIMFYEDSGQRSPYIHKSTDVVGLSYNSSELAEGSVKTAVALVADLAGPQEIESARARNFTLLQSYPNPFNARTTIEYEISKEGPVSLRIYNVAGQVVRTLVNGFRSPAQDPFVVEWDGRDDVGDEVASGVYYYRLVAAGFTQSKRMVFLK